MREKFPDNVERARITTGHFASHHGDPCGMFRLVAPPAGVELAIVAGAAELKISEQWEHVSVSARHRTPNWAEMSFVKELFWDPEETVIQLHVPRSRWINDMPNVLHLWKPPYDLPLPPSILVGDGKGVPATELEALQRQDRAIREMAERKVL